MNELAPIARAETALAFAETKDRLEALKKESARIVEITNPAGREECHAAAMVLKRTRVEIEKVGKAAREDANAYNKAIIAKENELIEIIDPEETRLLGLRDAWDVERRREKEEAERKERERLAAIRARIDAIKHMPLEAVGKGSAAVAVLIAEAGAIAVDDLSEEYQAEANEAKDAAVAKLREIHAAALDAEAKAEALAEERRQMEAEARNRAEAERIEREKHEAFEKAEREQRQAEETARRAAEQAELEAERRQLAEARKEQERIAAEAKAKADAELQAQREQLAKERAELDRQEQERAEAQRKEAAKAAAEHAETMRAEREREIAAATLESAAEEAYSLLCEIAPDAIATAKLGHVLSQTKTKRKAA